MAMNTYSLLSTAFSAIRIPIGTDEAVRVVFATFGVALLLISIFGGGISIKEISMPKIGWWQRILAFIFGLILIFMGCLRGPDKPGNETPTLPDKPGNKISAPPDKLGNETSTLPDKQGNKISTAPDKRAIRFTICDEITPDQIEKIINIQIDGKYYGQLVTNTARPKATLPIFLERGGIHQYTIEARAYWKSSREMHQDSCSATNQLEFENDKVYKIASSHEVKWILWLEQTTE